MILSYQVFRILSSELLDLSLNEPKVPLVSVKFNDVSKSRGKLSIFSFGHTISRSVLLWCYTVLQE